MLSNTEIGHRIEQVRLSKGLTLEEIATSIGTARSTIQRYEKGKINTLKLPVIQAIAKVLDVNPAWLIGKSEHLTPFYASALDASNSNGMHLSIAEKQIITSYRRASPAIQQAVLKLLDLPEESEISLSS